MHAAPSGTTRTHPGGHRAARLTLGSRSCWAHSPAQLCCWRRVAAAPAAWQGLRSAFRPGPAGLLRPADLLGRRLCLQSQAPVGPPLPALPAVCRVPRHGSVRPAGGGARPDAAGICTLASQAVASAAPAPAPAAFPLDPPSAQPGAQMLCLLTQAGRHRQRPFAGLAPAERDARRPGEQTAAAGCTAGLIGGDLPSCRTRPAHWRCWTPSCSAARSFCSGWTVGRRSCRTSTCSKPRRGTRTS